MHPAIKPPAPGYDSAQQGLAELCLARGPEQNSFCGLAEATLKAVEQHKCSDAKTLRKRLDGFSPRGSGPRAQGTTEKLDSFKERLDEEIERCWKFWNP